MSAKQTICVFIVAACAWTTLGHAQQSVPVLPGIDGLTPALLAPASGAGSALSGLLSNSPPPMNMPPDNQAEAPNLSNGVPGIDGINLSPAALGLAFRGLDPELVRAVLGNAEPRLISQIYEDSARVLPGLGTGDGGLLETLPGIDGLPIDLRR